MHTFKTNLWSFDLPENWSSIPYDDAVEFLADTGGGALRVESLRHDPRVITDNDLKSNYGGAPVNSITCGDFVGVIYYEAMPTGYMREWWLRSEHVMLYVKFVADINQVGNEDSVVDSILETLKNEDAQQSN